MCVFFWECHDVRLCPICLRGISFPKCVIKLDIYGVLCDSVQWSDTKKCCVVYITSLKKLLKLFSIIKSARQSAKRTGVSPWNNRVYRYWASKTVSLRSDQRSAIATAIIRCLYLVFVVYVCTSDSIAVRLVVEWNPFTTEQHSHCNIMYLWFLHFQSLFTDHWNILNVSKNHDISTTGFTVTDNKQTKQTQI